jgi:hypothetical protein
VYQGSNSLTTDEQIKAVRAGAMEELLTSNNLLLREVGLRMNKESIRVEKMLRKELKKRFVEKHQDQDKHNGGLHKPRSEDGKRIDPHVYYTYQYRVEEQTMWNDAEGRRYTLEAALTSENKEVREHLGRQLRDSDKWMFCGLGFGAEMLAGKTDEWHQVWCATGSKGFWSLALAKKVLALMRKRDAAGENDRGHQGGAPQNATRHQFRIVKMTHLTDVWEVV